MDKPTDRSYSDEAYELDAKLDEALAAIRRHVDSGEISLAEAAHQRIVALEGHIASIRQLRIEHFGDGDNK